MKIRNMIALMGAVGALIGIVTSTDARTYTKAMNTNSRVKASGGFRLSGRIEKKQFRPGEPIVLELTIRNVSSQVLYLTETNPEKDYTIIVKNEQGARVRLTKLGQQLANSKEDFRAIGVKVKPGEERKDRIENTKLHEVTAPGTYLVTASRMVRNRSGKWLEVISNSTTVTILH